MVQATASQLIDEIFESLGVFGKYQILQIIVVFTLTWPAGNQLYSIIYIGYQPPLRCHHPENSSLYTNDSSTRPYYETCKQLFDAENGTSCPYGYDYGHPKEASIVSEWDLVCGDSYQAQLAQTTLVIGQAVGATFFTAIADRFGRMRACIISQWAMLAISTGSIFASSPAVYIFLKFLTGVAQQGHVTAFFVMPLEVLPTRQRTIPHPINSIVWAVFLCVQVGFAYFLKDFSWRYHQVAITLTTVVTLIPNMLLLDESIRWLFANERIKEVRKIIVKATKMNNANPKEVEAKTKACILETSGELHTRMDEKGRAISPIDGEGLDGEIPKTPPKPTDNETEAEHKGTLKDIMKNPRLRTTTFIMFFAWIVNSLTSFGLSLTASKLSGNRFLNYFLIAVVPIPAGITSYYTLVKWGRRTTCVIFHAIAGVVLIAAVLLDTFMDDSVSAAVITLTMTGRFAIAASWNTLFLYTPELYPTNLRSLGLGISSSSSRLGGMLAPFSNLVIDYIPWLPGTVYGSSCILVCFLILYLPETLNRELPQTLDEIKEWNRLAKEKAKQEKLKKKGIDIEKSEDHSNKSALADKTKLTRL